MTSKNVVSLVSAWNSIKDLTPEEILRYASRELGFKHITYFGTPVGRNERNVVYTTYPADWKDHYFLNMYHQRDPVLVNAMRRVLPFDWQDIDIEGEWNKDFFGEAADFGISRNGISAPVYGNRSNRAIFSVNACLDFANWISFREHHISHIMHFAYLFHEKILLEEKIFEERIQLSPRELETLKWVACGKTNWEVGKILGLSDRTVEFYIKNICKKMDANNRTHAVAKSISRNIFQI